MNDLKYNWVTINSLSDQELFGVLSNIFEDSIIVINHQELHYIAKSHISNIHEGISEKEKNITSSKEKLNAVKTTINMEKNNITEKSAEVGKETSMQEVISSLIEEINELDDSKEEVAKHLLEEQVVSNLEYKTNIDELEKLNVEANTSGIKYLFGTSSIRIDQLKNTEKSIEISKEPTIQDVISNLIEEKNELDDSKEEVAKHLLEEQVVSNLESKTNIDELEKFNAEAKTGGIKHLLEPLNSIGPLKNTEKCYRYE